MSVITLNGNGFLQFPAATEEDTFRIETIAGDGNTNAYEFPAKVLSYFPRKNTSLKDKDKLDIITRLLLSDVTRGSGENLTKDCIKTAAKVYERSKDDMQVFIENYKMVGSVNCYHRINTEEAREKIAEIETSLSERFREAFRGRAPQIVHGMAVASFLYGIPEEDIVEKFNLDKVREGRNAGKLSPLQLTVLFCNEHTDKPGIYTSDAGEYAVKCYTSFMKGKGESYKQAADWITEHPDTSVNLLKKITKRADDLDIHPDTTVEAVKAKLGTLSSLSEVQKIEKQYKGTGFKFRKCEFDLQFSDTEYGNYRMEILRPGDTRMVYLGEFTHCCQKLYDIGESAMMHGLINPKAGFWAMTDKRTGRVVAQAEIWEKENDPTTLVFDNIEFANDAEISLYKEAIGAWLAESPYRNIYMGAGYNQLYSEGDFRSTDPITPSVTPYEIYVISHEEESQAPIFDSEEEAKEALESGRVTYYDYVYCDSENRALVMKENGRLEPYFRGVRPESVYEGIYSNILAFNAENNINAERNETESRPLPEDLNDLYPDIEDPEDEEEYAM